MTDIHEGTCGPHMSGHMLARKIIRIGYYWTTMEADCIRYVKKCHKCVGKFFVPIAMGIGHLPDDPLDVFVSCLYCPVHLRSVYGRVEMIDLELITEFLCQGTVKVFAIIGYQCVWHTVAAYEIMADEASDDPFGYMRETCSFDPFGEVIDGDQYEPITIRSMRMYGVDDVDAPG